MGEIARAAGREIRYVPVSIEDYAAAATEQGVPEDVVELLIDLWFLWEEGCFWWLTGSWARLPAILAEDPRVAVIVDTCDLDSGTVRQVSAHGNAELLAFDPDRARRKLVRYLGPDESTWDARFQIEALATDPSTRLVRLRPQRLIARDLSFRRGG